MSDDDRDLATPEPDAPDATESEELFAGHDADNDHLHLTIPELALGQTLANANVDGSTQARRRAKIMAWVLILTFVLPIVVGLLFSAFSS